jgi:hypothetical protein
MTDAVEKGLAIIDEPWFRLLEASSGGDLP